MALIQRKGSWSSVRVYFPSYSREELVRLLKTKLGELAEKLPLRSAVLFGSCARGNYTVASDVDLLVAYEGAKRDDIYGLIWDFIRLPRLQLHLYTVTEYEEVKRSDSALPREVAKDITLFETNN